jgi:hypothetical protein
MTFSQDLIFIENRSDLQPCHNIQRLPNQPRKNEVVLPVISPEIGKY